MSPSPAVRASPKVSVIIPNRDYARYLPEAIESVLAQTWRDCEILLSDDASRDDSAAILRRYAALDPRIRCCFHPAGLGMVPHWNWCLQQARGEYVKFLFADDLLASPDTLARLVDLLERHPGATMAASARLVLDAGSGIVGVWDQLAGGLHAGHRLIARCLRTRRNLIGEPSSVLFRRCAAERGFDPAFRQVVDAEMWFHLLTAGDLAYTREPLGTFRQHEVQQTAANHRLHVPELELIELLDRYLAVPGVAAHLRPGSPAHGLLLYRHLHYVAQSAITHPAASAAAARLRAAIPLRARLGFGLCHRLSRPPQNLARKLSLLIARRPLANSRRATMSRAAAFLSSLRPAARSGPDCTPAPLPAASGPAGGHTDHGKIIISGTGRAGTTFLVQLFTELGLDTGFTPQSWPRYYDAHCAAGLEHDIADPAAPRIVKNPALCEQLPALLDRGAVAVEHAIVPVRRLEEAARSRIWIGGRGRTPGGLLGTRRASRQRGVLAENFHRLVRTLTEHEIPTTFLHFPRFVRDPDYTWEKLRWLFAGIERPAFDAAFGRAAHPELIHDFSAGLPAGAGRPARIFARQKFLRRLRRAENRLLFAVVLVLAAWILTRHWIPD